MQVWIEVWGIMVFWFRSLLFCIFFNYLLVVPRDFDILVAASPVYSGAAVVVVFGV